MMYIQVYVGRRAKKDRRATELKSPIADSQISEHHLDRNPQGLAQPWNFRTLERSQSDPI